jgi:DNA adenine methylase
MTTALTPPLRWVGSKQRLIGELAARMPRGDELAGRRLVEPFVGSASVFLALGPRRALLADANSDLIALYRELVRDHRDVAWYAARLLRGHTPARYAEVRRAWNAGQPTFAPARAAAMIYLSRTGYNGLWRVNRAGDLNTPAGRPAAEVDWSAIADALEHDLAPAAAALARAELRCADYREVIGEAGSGDVLYLDPPYDGPGFAAYTTDALDQAALARAALAAARRGAWVVASNADTPRVRALYRAADGWTVDTVQVRRTVGARSRDVVQEVIAWHRGDRQDTAAPTHDHASRCQRGVIE